MSKIWFFALCVSFALFTGCASDGGKKVARLDTNSVTDLSGSWNDTDSRLVADEMINDCLGRPWYSQFAAQKGSVPTIVIGKVRNKSHEHIRVETFIKDIERALINSGKAEFVANSNEREDLRNELADQQGNTTEETTKDAGMEIGADLMLTGTINSVLDQEGGEQVVFYQIDMELTDIQSHRKVWLGDKKIKKYVAKSSVKF